MYILISSPINHHILVLHKTQYAAPQFHEEVVLRMCAKQTHRKQPTSVAKLLSILWVI